MGSNVKIVLAAALSLAALAGPAEAERRAASRVPPVAQLSECVATVAGRDDCSRIETFDFPQPVAVTSDTAVALEIKSEITDDAVLYWQSESMVTFVSDCGERFYVVGDDNFRTYVLRPNWKVSDRIVKIRVDFPYDRKNPSRKVSNSLRSIAFERRGFAPFKAEDADGIVFRMKFDEFEYLSLNWQARKDGAAPVPF